MAYIYILELIKYPEKSKPSLARFDKPSQTRYPKEPSETNRAAWKEAGGPNELRADRKLFVRFI